MPTMCWEIEMPKENIINLDDHRPHILVLFQDGQRHVIPVAFFQSIVAGRVSVEEAIQNMGRLNWESLVKAIFEDWLCVGHGIGDDDEDS